MSPTPTPYPAADRQAELYRLKRAIIEAGLADDAAFEGCGEDQVRGVVAAAGDVRLPDEFLDYLRVMGQCHLACAG
jgi:hypothetical protein